MTCTEEYKEHIESTFHAFCKVVIRNATINAARTRSRRYKREISLEYLTNEKHYPLGTADPRLHPGTLREKARHLSPHRQPLPHRRHGGRLARPGHGHSGSVWLPGVRFRSTESRSSITKRSATTTPFCRRRAWPGLTFLLCLLARSVFSA